MSQRKGSEKALALNQMKKKKKKIKTRTSVFPGPCFLSRPLKDDTF